MRNLLLIVSILFVASISNAKAANQCPTKDAQDTFWAAVKANNLTEVKALVGCSGIDVNKSYFFFEKDDSTAGNSLFLAWVSKSFDVASYLAQLPQLNVNSTVTRYLNDNNHLHILTKHYLVTEILRGIYYKADVNNKTTARNIAKILISRDDFDPNLESIKPSNQVSTFSVTYAAIDRLADNLFTEAPDLVLDIINHKNQKINDLMCVEDCSVRKMSTLEFTAVIINTYEVWSTRPLLDAVLNHKDMTSSSINSPYINFLIEDMCGWPEYWPGSPQNETYKAFVNDPRYEINRVKNHRGAIEASDIVAAASCGALEAVEILLTRKDLDINAIDKDGHTALYHAQSKGYTKIADLIKKNGGR